MRDLIYVSYSHQDKAWLEKLFIFLKPYQRKGRLAVWADPYIQVGDLWRREIDQALPRAKVGLLLVSPHFLASDFIMDQEVPPLEMASENGHARLFCVPLSSSVVAPTGLDKYQWARPPHEALDLLPEPQQHAALVTIAQQLVEVFHGVQPDGVSCAAPESDVVIPPSPSPAAQRVVQPVAVSLGPQAARAVIYGVPSQRPHFQDRPEELNRLKLSLVQGRHGAIGLTGETTKIGVHGQGGIGKTVLAIALTNDEEVQRAFPDGIYWFTLGQEPDLIACQVEWLKALGDQAPVVSSASQGKQQLQRYLAEKTCLLILDDVWQTEHAVALDVIGPKSRLLITTRDATILTAVGAKEESVGVLSEQAAVQLLAEWSGVDPTKLPPEAVQVADSCQGVPLALALAGAQIHEGMDWATLLLALTEGDLEFLDHPYGSIFKSMKLSVQALSEADRGRYLELVIFPEDAHVPDVVIERLWHETAGLTAAQSQKLLSRFARKSLLLRKDERSRFGISFHDLQHDFLRLLTPDAASVHRRLLESYGPCAQRETSDWSWSNLAEGDSYGWRYLAYHLIQGNRRSELTMAAKDLRYLGKKIWLMGSNTVEGDIQFALHGAEHDQALQRLQRVLSQSAHLVTNQPYLEGVLTTLLSRVQGEPMLQGESQQLESSMHLPYVKAVWPIPDKPDPALVRTLGGHGDWVRSCAINVTGQWIVSGADDQMIKVWDRHTGECLRTLKGHSGEVRSCAIDPTGQWIVSGSSDGMVKIWDLHTGDCLRTLKGHSAEVTSCAIDPTGQWIVSGSSDGTVKIWDHRTGRCLRRLEGHSDEVTSCAIDPTGQWIVSGSGDQTLRIWDRRTGECLRTLEGRGTWITSCAIDPTGQWIVSGSSDGTVKVWDRHTGECLRTLKGHSDWVRNCVIDLTGHWIVSGADDQTVKVWDRRTGECQRTLEGHSGPVTSCVIDPTGQWIVSGSGDQTLRIWDRRTGEYPRTLESHGDWVTSCAIDPTGQWIVSGSGDQTLRIWDRRTGECLRTLEGHSGPVTSCVIDPTGQWIVSGSGDQTLRVWDRRMGECLRRLEGHDDGVRSCAIDPTGQWIVSGSGDQTLRIWDRRTGECLRKLEGHDGGVRSCAIDPTGQWIVSGSSDQTLRIWDRRTGECLRRLEGHDDGVRSCAIDPTGQWLVSGLGDGTLKVWDWRTGECLRRLEGHSDGVWSCAIDPMGQWLVSGSADRGIRVWDLATGRLMSLLRVDGGIWGVAWVPHINQFVAVGVRGIYVFELVLPPRRS
ncbi:NB-ARC domain-containing protein [Candidatus Nitrospira nitrosa]|uniref:NB-ARC domain-containing protein n=1 Tax=Candidatus Nitrospira nitrosa TaxID=1742972 RepID=UPI00159ED2E8|nr:NB-ARC domain-containing protein [Candidatus Nitrospira nitrosa]